MKVYISTQNQYYFIGLSAALSQYLHCQCIYLDINDRELYQKSGSDDVLILSLDSCDSDFSLLSELYKTEATIIVTNDVLNWEVNSTLRFAILPQSVV